MTDDDYDDYEDAAPGGSGWGAGWFSVVYRWLLGIGGVAALVFGGVYLHYSFGGGAGPEQGSVPLIRAAEGPVKVRPENPGGRKVPNKDLDVYKEIDAAQLKGLPGKPSEDLLAPGKLRPAAKRDPVPKGPVCHPVPTLLADTGRYRLAALKLASSKLAASKPAAAEKAAEPRAKRPAPKTAPKTATKTVLKSVPKSVRTARAAREVDTGKAGAGKAAVRKASTRAGTDKAGAGTRKPAVKNRRTAKAGKFRIQLGAFRTRAKAARHGQGLQRKHHGLLGQLNMVVVRVDLGSRGIFYRLRAGPFANRQSARELCRSLGKRRIDCFLVSG
ncbi:MAG: SPOR domain-containing protein [Rhodospirillaceae bacterium]|nr:SPOR domain-containing protein [Rhodospirillaceae bacterium]MYH37676.1 SPOR domain-containing protein [Rhodospirillaceae bacterium]MYK14279.1 SPOR domain-containing protein [Rhodospirillaceae bacterium]MYK58211.1 SPOR domain-containing protein [Rhodospirillaceae bacterium]